MDKDLRDVRVVEFRIFPHNDAGAERAAVTLMVPMDNGMEQEVQASCAPWLYYLHPVLAKCAEMPEQRFAGFSLTSKQGRNGKTYHNIEAIEGFEEPADHQEKMVALGLGVERVPANGKPAMSAADLMKQSEEI